MKVILISLSHRQDKRKHNMKVNYSQHSNIQSIWVLEGEIFTPSSWKFDRGTIIITGSIKRPFKTFILELSIDSLLSAEKVNKIKSNKKSQQIVMINNMINGEKYNI